jgi:Protein of unknown function (DUF2490)
MIKNSLIVAFLSLSSICLAQPAVVDQPIEWFAITSTSKLTKNINVYADVHLRYAKGLDPMQNQIRIAPEWVFSKTISFAPIGFVYVRNFLYGDQPAKYENNEHRFYQQLLIKHSSGKWAFNHRLRVEERYIQIHASSPTGDIDQGFTNQQTRIRYRGLVTYAFNKPKVEAGAFFGSFYDEFFVSWGSKVTYNSPDQNRLYLGVGYQFSKNVSLQTGFFYQALIKSNGVLQENNVGVMTQFTYNFDFSKKEN